jgi:glucose dehydrogenase
MAAMMPAGRAAEPPSDGWPVYGHDAGNMRHSPLTDITPRNVGRLAVAWTFHAGDTSDGGGNRPRSGFEATPIVVDDTLYFTTATNRIIALDPETAASAGRSTPKIETRGELRRRPDQSRRGGPPRPGGPTGRTMSPAYLRSDA